MARKVTVWPNRAGLAVEVNASRLAAFVTVCVTELEGAPGAKSVSPEYVARTSCTPTGKFAARRERPAPRRARICVNVPVPSTVLLAP